MSFVSIRLASRLTIPVLVLLSFLLTTTFVDASITYHFASSDYKEVSGHFNTNMHLELEFDISEPLLPDTEYLVDPVIHLPGFVGFRVNDGLNSYSGIPHRFWLQTDSFGAVAISSFAWGASAGAGVLYWEKSRLVNEVIVEGGSPNGVSGRAWTGIANGGGWSVVTSAVPEPTAIITWLLLGTGGVGMCYLRHRRRTTLEMN